MSVKTRTLKKLGLFSTSRTLAHCHNFMEIRCATANAQRWRFTTIDHSSGKTRCSRRFTRFANQKLVTSRNHALLSVTSSDWKTWQSIRGCVDRTTASQLRSSNPRLTINTTKSPTEKQITSIQKWENENSFFLRRMTGNHGTDCLQYSW